MSGKLFAGLNRPLICEHKTSALPFEPTGILHNHDGYEILLFLEGDAGFFSEQRKIPLRRGDLLLIHPYFFHRVEPREECRYDRIVLNITEEYLRENSSTATNLADCFSAAGYGGVGSIRLPEEQLSVFIRLADALEQALQKKQFGDDLLAKSCFVQFMVLLNRSLPSKPSVVCPDCMPRLVSETFSYIEQHLSEDITLSELAGQIHHNADYIGRCFKQVTGLSIQQFIIAKRLAVAQKLLREGTAPGDACCMSGFHDYSNFSRTFAKHIGQSPKQYQKERRTLYS
ncbi:MAG: helix-turn-helix domain-containing protein [Lachnospiraceae bacterium]